VQAFRYGGPAFALQFHPDVTHATMCRWTVRGHDRMLLPNAAARRAFRRPRIHDPPRAWLAAFSIIGWEGRGAESRRGDGVVSVAGDPLDLARRAPQYFDLATCFVHLINDDVRRLNSLARSLIHVGASICSGPALAARYGRMRVTISAAADCPR
jgi:hypothetical protein